MGNEMVGVLKKNLAGQTFGMLRVIGIGSKSSDKAKYVKWFCRCDCGTHKLVATHSLLSGNAKTCGCVPPRKTHGQTGTAEHRVWKAMLSRCGNPGQRSYPQYGGRGISVCDRWRSFENFLADMGPRPTSEHQIDRIDNDGNYDPANCRWVTRQENCRNRRSNRLIECGGMSLTIAEWSDRTGLPQYAIGQRLRRGWPVEEALKPIVIPPAKGS